MDKGEFNGLTPGSRSISPVDIGFTFMVIFCVTASPSSSSSPAWGRWIAVSWSNSRSSEDSESESKPEYSDKELSELRRDNTPSGVFSTAYSRGG